MYIKKRSLLMGFAWLGFVAMGCTQSEQPEGAAARSSRVSSDEAGKKEKAVVGKKGNKRAQSSSKKTVSKKGKEYNSIEQAKAKLAAKNGMIWFGDFDDLEAANESTPAQKEQWTCGYNSVYYAASRLSISELDRGLAKRYNANRDAPSSIRKGLINGFYKKKILASKAGDFMDSLGDDAPKSLQADRNKTVAAMLDEEGIDTSAAQIDLCELAKIKDLGRFFKSSNCRSTNVGPTPQLVVTAINRGLLGSQFRAQEYGFDDFDKLLSYIVKEGESKKKGVVVLGFNPNSRLDGWHYMSVIGAEVDNGAVVHVVMRNTNGDIRYWPVAKLQEWMDSQRKKGLSTADRYVAKQVLPARFSGVLLSLDK
ncbi:MAG: hypothetical protein AAF310_04615 [Myxococcota bacterium]